jgi:DNA polymerase
MMLVGEQPGEREDVVGRPFVGPAGRVLDDALAEAGIARADVYVTNAVKHFKYEQRGKRRLHKKPNAYEIDRCRWWLDAERALVRPQVVIALGVTAVRSLLGRPVSIARLRGSPVGMADGSRLVATIHPSYLLRIREPSDRRAAHARFVGDLKEAVALLTKNGAKRKVTSRR